MKNMIANLVLCLMLLGFYAEAHPAYSDPIPNPMDSPVSTPKNLEYDQIDPTDALAVPSDSSNLDIEIEMRQLEERGQRNLERQKQQSQPRNSSHL